MMREMRGACDRTQDGDVRSSTFVVPESYRTDGLYEYEKEFSWTCIVTTMYEVCFRRILSTVYVLKVHFRLYRIQIFATRRQLGFVHHI